LDAGLSPRVCLNNQGLPVVSIPYREEEQNRVLEKEIGRLVSQGVQLKGITILSPHVLHKSCMAGKSKIKEWPVGSRARYLLYILHDPDLYPDKFAVVQSDGKKTVVYIN
jgi:hypothetical protein